MRRLLNSLKNAAFFLLCYAQIPLLAGYFLLNDCVPLLVIQAVLLPVSFLVSLVPGKIGGGRSKNNVMVERASHGSDPDPDRALRNEALPLPEKKAFPLRAFVCLLASLGVLIGVFFLPIEAAAGLNFLNRCLMAFIMAVMLPLAVKVVAVNADHGGSVTAGMILYVMAGIIAYFAKDAALESWLLICGVAFLALTAFAVNNTSMAKGASVREGVRPPAGMRRKNRVVLAVIAVIGCVIVYFDRIRQTVVDAVQWLGVKLWAVIMFLANLFAGDEVQEAGGGGGGGDMDMTGMFGPAESSPFWKAMEKVAIVLTVIIGAVAVFFFLRMVWRQLLRLIRRLIDKIKKFTAAVGEEYQDEQESLFDWGETKKELGDSIKKRLDRLTRREKKWEQMDARERVRFVVRSLYRKSPESGNLRALTVHEALSRVKTGQAQPEELANAYDQARYGKDELDMQTAERLRKEAKV